MLSHMMVTAKLRPEIWSLIATGVKRWELRYGEYVCTPDVFQFIHPDTRMILGYARIVDEVRLVDWTPGLLAQLGTVDVELVEALFKDRRMPVHAYHVIPVEVGELLDGFARRVGDDMALNRELLRGDGKVV